MKMWQQRTVTFWLWYIYYILPHFLKIVILFKRYKEIESFHLLVYSQMPAKLRAGPSWNWEPELNPGLLHRIQSQVCESRKPEWKVEPRLKLRYYDMSVLSSVLTTMANAYPWFPFVKINFDFWESTDSHAAIRNKNWEIIWFLSVVVSHKP